MILWLASYPRSGNTFLRTLLFKCFGVETYSIYNDKSDIGKTDSFAGTVGHRAYNGTWEAFYENASNSQDPIAIKTHGAPIDDAKAIYVVRDARASIVSFYHYLLKYSRYKVDMYDVISGAVSYGSWSQHFNSWSPAARPNTLFLTFEELTGQPALTIAKIAEFTNLPLENDTPPTFSELQRKFPEFFRSGSNKKNVDELTEEQLAYLFFLHGDLLRELSYIDDYSLDPSAIRQAIDLQSEKLLGFRLSGTSQIQTDMYHVKHIVSEIREKQNSDRELIRQSEYFSRKLLELQKERISAIEKQAEIDGQEKNSLSQGLNEARHELEKTKNKLQKLEHILAPNLTSLVEFRALRYVLAERQRIKSRNKSSSQNLVK